MPRSNGKKVKRGKKNSPYRPQGPITCVTLRDTIPDQMKVPMRYYDDFDLTGAVIADEVINLNSIFDPDRTGVGHQPLGYDQWSAFYNRYRVDSVHIQLDAVNLSTTSVADFIVHNNNDGSAVNTSAKFLAAGESPFTTSRLIATSAGNNIWHHEEVVSLAAITGVTEEKYRTDDLYSGQFGSSPTEVIALHLCAKDFSFTTNIALKVRVTLTFYVTMFDRLELALS